MAYQDWAEGLRGLTADEIKHGISVSRDTCHWAPSIAQFRQFCLESRRFPTNKEILDDVIRRDFKHGISKVVYDKIGSWSFQTESERDLIEKISEVTTDYRNGFKTV